MLLNQDYRVLYIDILSLLWYYVNKIIEIKGIINLYLREIVVTYTN